MAKEPWSDPRRIRSFYFFFFSDSIDIGNKFEIQGGVSDVRCL